MSTDRDRPPIPGVRRAIEVPPSKRRVHRSVQEELRFHLEERIEELVAAGMSREDAEAEARTRFGDLRAIGSELETIDLATHRRRTLRESLHDLARDSRYAVRTLLRQPGFTLIVVLTLALGIGANTAIFSAVNAVLLRPLPTPWLDRMVVVRHDMVSLNLLGAQLSVPEVLDLIERTEVFETGAGYGGADFTLTGAGAPRRVSGTLTVGDFFGTFGMQPLFGRFHGPDDSRPDREPVVVLSHGTWREMFGGDPNAVGGTIELNGRGYEIIGIARPDERFPRSTQLWVPRTVTPQVLERRGTLNTTAVFVRRDGVSPEMLANVLAAEYAEWMRVTSRAFGESQENRIFATPLVEYTAGELRPILLALMAAVMFVLLIACANVAGLQLVRATGRARELAVRVALGAGRWPIIRQRLVESLVLALAGGALGLALGALAIGVMRGLDIGGFAALRDVRLDAPVLSFTALVVVLAGIIFGLAPALRAARVDPQDALKETPRGATSGTGRQRFLQGAVVVQLALALVLLLGAGLAVRSLARLLETDLGFSPDPVLTMQISPSGARYASPDLRDAFRRELLDRLGGAPGVLAAGIAYGLPFSDQSNSSPFDIAGAEPLPNGERRHANMWFVGGDYFQAMGIPIVAGRAFDERDRLGAETVLMIDEQLAKEYFPGQDPIGRHISQGPEGTVIGIVASVKKSSLGEPPKAAIYHPFAQNTWAGGWTSIALRGTGAPETLVNTARTVIRGIDPGIAVYDIQPMRTRVDRSVGARRFAMQILGGFATLALLLSGLGIYGVISYGTSQRRQEIGIRMALGAQPAEVIGMVLRGGAALAAVGLALGALVFLGVESTLTSLLYGLSPRDPLTMVASVLILGTIAMLACWIPARRAARVDPTVALRAQ
jgi:predicted permease